jgi:hypothetical protein
MPATYVLIPILLVFYLYLLVRKEHVAEPGLYRLGLLGFLLMFVGVCIGGRAMLLFQWIGFLWALFGAVAACAGFRGPYDSQYRPDGWGAPKKTESSDEDSEKG